MAKLVTLKEEQLQRFRRLIVLGDVHGDYETLESALRIADPAKDGIILLGDYADRGPFGIEVVDAVCSLVKKHLGNVFALKGNHEDYKDSGAPEFWPCDLIDEAERKRGDWHSYFENTFNPFVKRLKLAVIVPGETLFVHGGISSKIRSLDDLKHPTKTVEKDILWSDPFEGRGERENERGCGVEFGADVTESVCKLLGVERIVRSHQPTKALIGPFYSHDSRVITVSSTSVYNGRPFILTINPSDSSRPRPLSVSFLDK